MVRSRGILIQRAMHVVVRHQVSNIVLPRPKSDPYKAGDTATLASVCLGLARPTGGPSVTAALRVCRSPSPSVLRNPSRPWAAYCGIRLGEADSPGGPKRAKTRVSSAPQNSPMCWTHSMAHTHTACRNVSIQIETNAHDFLRCARAMASDNLVCAVQFAMLRSSLLIKHRLPPSVTISP